MDIHMPGIGGIEAARQIRAARPDVMIVLMSTYDVEDLPFLPRLRCGHIPAQRTPVSRFVETDMASGRLRFTSAAASVPKWRAENLVVTAFRSSSLGHDLMHRYRAERFELFLSGHLAMWASVGILLPL